MKLRWTTPAADKLENIVDYIAMDNADAAARLAGKVESSIKPLLKMPLLGRRGKFAGTRELPIAGTPYIVIYRVKQDVIEIVSLLHGAQEWPPSL